jgi:hypothetical protein
MNFIICIFNEFVYTLNIHKRWFLVVTFKIPVLRSSWKDMVVEIIGYIWLIISKILKLYSMTVIWLIFFKSAPPLCYWTALLIIIIKFRLSHLLIEIFLVNILCLFYIIYFIFSYYWHQLKLFLFIQIVSAVYFVFVK